MPGLATICHIFNQLDTKKGNTCHGHKILTRVRIPIRKEKYARLNNCRS